MCGLAGLIGKSKHPKLTYDVITKLFHKTETRGVDAAGFWAVTPHGRVLYHRQPIRASEMIKQKTWKQLQHENPYLLLAHARHASQGVGHPSINENNHPFVAEEGQLSLIHNGQIPSFRKLREKFATSSDCDSEVLLRIITAASNRLDGIRDVYAWGGECHMAVALGSYRPGYYRLYLFRNKHRTLWLVDLRHNLGQLFFCSTFEIWQNASSMLKQKVIEIPENEIWDIQFCNGAFEVQRYSVRTL